MNTSFAEYGRLLATYLRPYRPRVALLALVLLAGIALQIAAPQLMRYFIDAAGAGGRLGALVGVALLFLLVSLLQQLATVGATYLGEDLGWKATNQLRLDLARHCLQLDLSFHNTHSPGELIERIDGDVKILANFFSQLVIQVLGSVLLVSGILVLLFAEDWRIGLALTIFVLLAFVLLLRMRNLAVPYWTAARQYSAQMYGFLEERLRGTIDIRSSGAQAYVMHHFYRLQRLAWRATVKAGLMATAMVNTTWILFAIGNAVALMLGASLFGAGALTLGSVYLVYYYSLLLTRPIELITRQLDDLHKAGASIARVRELRSFRSSIADGPGIPLPSGPLAVEFQQAGFAYDTGRPVLHDISFRLAPGTVLGLLGHTGSGKTTLTRLLLRLYDPDNGVVRIGGGGALWDIRQARLAQLGHSIGMVTQSIQLFDASVRDNLTFFDSTIPDARIVEVLGELGLGRWYAALPDGLDTRLAGGGGLSAGEAQLLAFTRIFLKDQQIVILDEASSRLDPATEQLIEHAVDKLVRGRTVIIIAHRLQTVERADQIMILEAGRIREYGPREQLARDPEALFARLLRTGGLEDVLR